MAAWTLLVFATVMILGVVLDRRRVMRHERIRRMQGFAVVEVLVVGTLLAITAATLILAVATLRSF